LIEQTLTPAPEIHPRTLAPTLLRIPELDAANPATIAGEIDNAGLVSSADSLTNLKHMIGAVFEVNNHPLEFNRPALDPELNGSETFAPLYGDAIVIIPPVYMRLPEHFPSVLGIPTSLVVGVPARAALSQEVHVRARAQTPLRIPKLDAANSATITGEIDHTRSTLIGDSISNLNFVVGAAVEVDNHSLKLDRPASNFKQERSETLAPVDGDPIVVPSSIDIRSPELFPSVVVSSTPVVVATPLRI